MKSPPIQIHDDIAHNRVEDFIRGDDSEVLDGTEKLPQRKVRKLSTASTKAKAKAAAAEAR
jgi:hypothetical protein